MKKLVSLILILCMACMLIPAVAEEDITGEWYGDLYGMEITLTMNADNTAKMSLPGMGDVADYSWVESNGLLILTESVDGTKMEGKLMNGELTINDGDEDIVFTREHVEGIQVAEVNPDAAAEDFEGTWAISSVRAEEIHARAEDMDMGDIGVVIKDGKLEFTGNAEDMTFFLGEEAIPMTYENGALGYSIDYTMGDESVTLKLIGEMLQDGMFALSLDMDGDGFTYFFNRVEAE